MNYTIPILYQKEIPNLSNRLGTIFDQAIDNWQRSAAHDAKIRVFFRADDIGVPSKKFTKLIQLFQKHYMPLCLAVVPAWLTARRTRELLSLTGSDDSQWCWHQHGRLHKNFEPSGKKQEFGPARSREEVGHHLELGQSRLQELLQDKFSPYFTPPWNRCSLDTAQILKSLNFNAISRFTGAQPDFTDTIAGIDVNVDLHTGKENSSERAADKLFDQLHTALGSGYCGIMIHHQLMNDHAFHLLDLLLTEVAQKNTCEPCLFQDFS
ncbi:polysaccharide deacetylase family protein [Desulfosediminicola ganghwensis]|uniref:polysaccharide deacetylase family protein n=1 Tax=Desulfosediminicola ganghwensis TaxID=2569540 RepID=UPI0010AC3A5F|nr:polysaccharide deacetylase family protein [Desulfosediminicola ganghwensis]